MLLFMAVGCRMLIADYRSYDNADTYEVNPMMHACSQFNSRKIVFEQYTRTLGNKIM
jgi:hypothetical protein